MTRRWEDRIARHWIWGLAAGFVVMGWIYFGWLGVLLAAAIEYAVYVVWRKWGKP